MLQNRKDQKMTSRLVFLLVICTYNVYQPVHGECVYTVRSGDRLGPIGERMGCGFLTRTGAQTEGYKLLVQLNRDILKVIPSESRLQIGDRLTGA